MLVPNMTVKLQDSTIRADGFRNSKIITSNRCVRDTMRMEKWHA